MSVPLRRPAPASASVPAGRDAGPRPALGMTDAMALIVGTVVGVGIFKTPSLVAGTADSAGLALLAWLAGGAVSVVGALCYAELATAYPHAGGDYHYLTRAFGPRLGFLFAWARISVIQTGAIALHAFVVGDYAAALLPLGGYASPVYGVLVVAGLTGLNVLGVRQGKTVQNLLTAAQVVGVLLVVLAGLRLAGRGPALTEIAQGSAPSASALGLMMVFVLLTYGGWNEAAYLSAEVREPRRNMVRALVSSLLLVTALYLLMNWAYLAGLGLDGMATSKAVAADLVQRAAGSGAAALVSLLVVLCALTSANAAVFTGARTSYALGRDFPSFAFLGRWHERGSTPTNALLVQGLIAAALVGLGALTRTGFEAMVEYTAPVFWFFFLLTGVALFVLRRQDRAVARPFRVPLYPLTPLVFCATCAYLLYASIAYTGVGALAGVAVLGAGALLLLLGVPAAGRARPVEGGN
jgi:basic amino acid/polyamine antiporter, APA family